jgi:hypothetical protein
MANGLLSFPVIFRTMDIRADTAIAAAVQQAIGDAESLWSPEKFDGIFPTKGFGIKRLQPRDIVGQGGSIVGPSNSTWVLSVQAASVWQGWISAGGLSDSCYCIITGFFNYDASPDIDAIKIIADGIEYATYDIQEAWGWDIATAYFSHPIVVRPEKTITIKVKAQTPGQKKFGLLGYALGKRSYLIGEL